MQPNIASRLNIPNFFHFDHKPVAKKLIYSRPEHLKLTVVQPHMFPDLAYFHLLESTEEVVFFDDLNFNKKGWVNRNKILLNGKEHRMTIPLEKASQNKPTNQLYPKMDDKYLRKYFETLETAYGKAPYYEDVLEMIEDVFDSGFDTIVDLAIFSIVKTYEYLGKDIKYLRSSICSRDTRSLKKAERQVAISQKLAYSNFVTNDVELSSSYFNQSDIKLSLLNSQLQGYKQLNNSFVPGLSIIDVLMFNSPTEVLKQLNSYQLA